MKKSIILMFAAVVALSVTSCVKEEFEAPVHGTRHTYTCSLEGLTRTSLTDEGKTVWNENDSVRFISGSKDTILVVPAEADGQKSFTFEISDIQESEPIFAVYPISVAASVADGKMKITIPSTQDGTFASANIAAAKCETYEFNFKNVTGVLKFNVPEDMPLEVKSVAFTASNVIAGQISVDFSGDDVTVTPVGTGKSILVNVDALPGDYYAAAVPGEYAKGFSLTAVGTDFAYQKKELQGAKTLSRNEIAYLGVIGDQLRALWGDGSESDPWKISSLPEWLALAYFVNGGNEMEGQYVKVTKPISGINAPVGTYNDIEKKVIYFKGKFDGNNQPLTIETSGDGYQALFGAVGKGAEIKNVNVSGAVNSASSYAAGVAAYVITDTVAVVFENCVNNATVNGTTYVGGIFGYSNANSKVIEVTDCKNNAAITADYNVGGLTGYATNTIISNGENSGLVTAKVSTGHIYMMLDKNYRYGTLDGKSAGWSKDEYLVRRATGGIAGMLHNSIVKDSKNLASVNGLAKIGGVAGCLYWSDVKNCENSGVVTATEDLAGGLAGCIWQQGSIQNCVNKATVNARAGVGGILAVAVGANRNSATYMTVKDCVNESEVVSTGLSQTCEYDWQGAPRSLSAAGGIVGVVRHFQNDFVNVVSCHNMGNVRGAGQAMGGIVGYQGCPRQGSDKGVIDKCINDGNVTSNNCQVGGILGYSFDRLATQPANYALTNCVNNGTVTALYGAGGIAGVMQVLYPDNPGRYGYTEADAPGYQKIYNCLNNGDVIYTTTDTTQIKNAQVGGLLGFDKQTRVWNSVNNGRIIGVHGTDLDVSATVGSIVGRLHKWGRIAYCYVPYNEDNRFNGTTLDLYTSIANLAMFDAGELDVPVTVDGTEYTSVLDALNAWVAANNGETSTYVEWIEGENGPTLQLEEGE